LYIWRLYM